MVGAIRRTVEVEGLGVTTTSAKSPTPRPAVATPAEVTEALDRVDDFTARCNGDDVGSCASVKTLRTALASPRAGAVVPDGWKLVESDSLPPGYKLGRHPKDGSYWPLFDSWYLGNDWYKTTQEAQIAAWKHAHGRLADNMRHIHRVVMLAAATEVRRG